MDINFRANLLELRCLYVPTAKAFHIGSDTTGSTFNSFTIRLTTKNIFNVVVKNYPISFVLKSLPVIFIYHAWWFFIILERKQLFAYFRGLVGALQDSPKMWKKRKEVLLGKRISKKVFWSRIVNSEREVMKSILRRRKTTGKATWPVSLYMKMFL